MPSVCSWDIPIPHVDRSASGANSNLNGFLPKGMLDVGIDYQHDKLSASVTGKGIFHREGAWGTNPVSQYKNYWVWDTVVNYQITPQAQLYVKLNNIFNQFYTEQEPTVLTENTGIQRRDVIMRRV